MRPEYRMYKYRGEEGGDLVSRGAGGQGMCKSGMG